MNLFADYIQPLTDWLQTNPRWSLFITFIIALAESLAIVGSIIPGSVTMTAIGILAGSGIMRIDLTMLAATLGAVCGDSLSYALGYIYSDRLVEIWPFNKYPNVLNYGKEFFSRHGGKSVLIGRFIGPLRSFIPVIAGIMHMKQWRFLITNIVSGIGWALLYVMPGVLIGAAGHELSTEGASRLFVLILALMAGIWFISFLLKVLILKLNNLFKTSLHSFWVDLKNQSILSGFYNAITPKSEKNHYPTAGLVLFTLLSLISFFILFVLSKYTSWLNQINVPLHLLAQSFHTKILEVFFIFCAQSTSIITLVILCLFCLIWLLKRHNWRVIAYLISLICTTFIVSIAMGQLNFIPRPQGLLVTLHGSSFPASDLAVGTAFYMFLLLFINNQYTSYTNSFRTLVLTVLFFGGVAAIYLGDYWFTDVIAAYLLGVTISLMHWIMYRKSLSVVIKKNGSEKIIIFSILVFIGAMSLSTYFNFKNSLHVHTYFDQQFTLTEGAWWNQQKPILPLYRLNRIGKKISLLNIQYNGELDLFKSELKSYGWKVHTESFFTKLLMVTNTQSNGVKLPLLAQLFENKKPVLTMTYTVTQSNLIIELTLWESNYKLHESNKPLWIGTIHQNASEAKNRTKNAVLQPNAINTISYIMPALNQFTLRRVKVPKYMINTTAYSTAPYILLIRKSSISDF